MKYYFFERNILTWICILLISVLTVIKVSPEGLNADILINSVMSLQNLTLYYWGQNRILNALPLAVTLIKNPTLNLAATLILTSMCFYGMLYLVSRSAAMLLGEKNESAISFKTFLIISSAFVIVFVPHAVSEITIGHIEYSFPALLLLFAALRLLRKRDSIGDWWSLILPVAAIVLAIGLNPSTVIPALFISMAAAFYKKRVRLNELVLLGVSGVAFIVWDFVSKRYGNLPYNEFKLEIFCSGVQKVVGNLLSAINLPILFFLIAIISVGRIIFIVCKNTSALDNASTLGHSSITSYATNAAVLFSIGWLVLFASNRWVEMNQFSWRYFIYVFFALLFFCAVYLSRFLIDLNAKKSLALTIIVVIAAILSLVPSVARFNFSDYRVFQRVNTLTEPGGRLYSGDYWVVWPSVLRDMMNGYEAYGLTTRGESNKEAARRYVLRQIEDKENASVFCLNDTVQNCISQVIAVAGPLFVVDSNQLKEGVYLIDFAEQASFLDFKGRDFLNLPSQVGIVENTVKKTQSHAGYLVYGPYAPIKSGRYLLSVFGSSTQLEGAYIDVVSDKGVKIHAKFELTKGPDSYLIRNAEVNLPVNISDLEVRVWVGEKDEIKLFGYSLKAL